MLKYDSNQENLFYGCFGKLNRLLAAEVPRIRVRKLTEASFQLGAPAKIITKPHQLL